MNVKSLLTVLTTALLTYGGLATIKPLDFNTCTEAEVRAKVEECMAAPDPRQKTKNLTDSHIVWQLPRRKDLAALRDELDARFAAEHMRFKDTCYGGWPKTCASSISDTERVRPVRARLIKKYGHKGIMGCPLQCYTPEEMIELINECFATGASLPCITGTLSSLNSQVVKIVRKHLYDQGKSFITKNGVNPCEKPIEEFTAALNAPRLAGLNEWFADMGVPRRINLDFLPSEEEVVKLEQDILTGEKEINDKYKVVLYFGLGSEKYNAFVKCYNGDK